MKRLGECKQCGECCTRIGWTQLNTIGFDEWAMTRGLTPTYEEDGQIARVSVPHVCPHFISVGGESMCNLHGMRDKPDVCQMYPVSPEQLLPGCGYSFVDEEA